MRHSLKQLLSATEFPRDEVTAYARDLILPETRVGLLWLAFLLLALQLGVLLLEVHAGRGTAYFYTFCLLSVLSLHMLWSVRFVRDTVALHYLAITYLVVYAMATVLVAHRAGDFHVALMASAIMLVIAVPLVPWGLREALVVTLLIYTLFTGSTLAVEGRFESQTLWTLQFLFIASATIAMVLVARNVRVRKQDIESRYDLEQAQRRHQQLSLTDPLTGAYNRRFLEQNYAALVREAVAREQRLVLGLLDIDQFKRLNDSYGHHCGDRVLKQLVHILVENLPGDSLVVRIGGDEFAVVLLGRNSEEMVRRCLRHLETDPIVLRATGGTPVTVSAGFTIAVDGSAVDLDEACRRADVELYAAKRRHRMGSAENLAAPLGANP